MPFSLTTHLGCAMQNKKSWLSWGGGNNGGNGNGSDSSKKKKKKARTGAKRAGGHARARAMDGEA